MTARQLCVRVVHPDLDPDLAMWGDGQGGWQPDALEWVCTLAAAGVPFRAGPNAAADDGAGLLLLPDPNAVDMQVRTSRPVLTGPPPTTVEERLSALARALGALVVPDLRGVMVLRLDDLGAAVKRHLTSWKHPDVTPEAWAALGQGLGDGRVSFFSCPGWVTEDGTVVDSRLASPAEWRSIDACVQEGWADLECHGYTHMDPDLERWTSAPGRLEDPSWYREMWPPRRAEEPGVDDQRRVIASWQQHCGQGTALVAPGEAWGLNTVRAAAAQGLRLFNSWGLCRLDLDTPTWTVGVGSPYLDQAEPSWFEPGLPVIGYWHDRDMAVYGPTWAPAHLSRWRECGARRMVAFSDLAGAYQKIDAVLVGTDVEVRRGPPAWPLRRIAPHSRASN